MEKNKTIKWGFANRTRLHHVRGTMHYVTRLMRLGIIMSNGRETSIKLCAMKMRGNWKRSCDFQRLFHSLNLYSHEILIVIKIYTFCRYYFLCGMFFVSFFFNFSFSVLWQSRDSVFEPWTVTRKLDRLLYMFRHDTI